MLSIERLWNALALGGVLSALLATAGVVNLGNLPHLPSFGLSLGGLSLGGTTETATLALPAPTPAHRSPSRHRSRRRWSRPRARTPPCGRRTRSGPRC